MPVPEFTHFIRPALKAVADMPGAHWREHMVPVMNEMGLTEDDFQDLTPGTGKPRLEDRMQWALAYLRGAKLIVNTKWGHNEVTERGMAFLKRAPAVIKPADLCEFPEFVTFYKGSPKVGTKGKPAAPVQVLAETPQERIQEAFEEIRSALASDLLERLLQTHPARFERVIVDLMLAMGYGGSREEAGLVVGKPGDGGVDGIIRQDKLGLDNIYLQAKRWKDTVGPAEVDAFIGALTRKGANKGVLITTSTFSEQAKRSVENLQNLKVSLIDGGQLALLMIDHGLGVSEERSLVLRRVDSDYFSDD